MEKFSSKDFKSIILAILFCSFILLFLGYKIKINAFGCALMFLPMVFSLFFTCAIYRRYKKFLKSAVDFIIYFPASIAASFFLIRIMFDISKEVFFDIFNSDLIAFYAYFVAIAVATKCCVCFCDAVFSYKEERAAHLKAKGLEADK
ncbi:hypothetical protein [Erwinia amylovora]|uniref:hypothetical protein n=1 Tax=Erwinia amylovora TaxID=552 RepID=UPI001444409B|nr:hypothetical protein [Erwinia amylovora]